ncbi:hypothetical protein MFLAVUS_007763 [Mucor flavus]|uniref:Uncharacterized protein n=1 Tax=Mucor flavus TaxID=439312 RepID=A0ABP9Z584_9FUNG
MHTINVAEWNILPPNGSSLIINGVNISNLFYAFRLSAKEEISLCKNGNDIETSLSEILSLSGILLLQKEFDHDEGIKRFIDDDLYKSMYKNSKVTLCNDAPSFGQDLYFKVKNISAENVLEPNGHSAMVDLLGLCKNATEFEAKAIRSIIFLQPELTSMNIKTMSENHTSSNLKASDNKRPDYEVDNYVAYVYDCIMIYGEIKNQEIH